MAKHRTTTTQRTRALHNLPTDFRHRHGRHGPPGLAVFDEMNSGWHKAWCVYLNDLDDILWLYPLSSGLSGYNNQYSRKKLTIHDIHYIYGLHLIVEEEKDCYKALKVVHRLWSEVPGKLKDYICYPKFNGLKSLYTGDG